VTEDAAPDEVDRARERLQAAATASGGPLTEDALARLVRYLEEVVRSSRDVNLTAATSLDEAVDVLAVSALAVRAAWPAERRPPRLVVDLGSGNGFPGVVAALVWPTARVLLVERRAKKAVAVAGCCARAGIANAEAVACDGRELLRERPEVKGGVDLVTARAVGTLEETMPIAAPWLAPGARVAVWKGANLSAEEAAAGDRAARSAGLVALPELRFPIPPGPSRLLLFRTVSDSFRKGGRRSSR
jgi:16S rRNA (guanine527-N7)-methyltransferase